MTETDQEKAETLANFFTSVFTEEPTGTVPYIPSKEISIEMEDLYITNEMVLKVLRTLNENK